MALQTAEITYTDTCSKPLCLCVDTPVFLFLQDGELTTDNRPFLLGVVTSVVEQSDLSVVVTISYDDSTQPGGGWVFSFPVGGSGGTVCAPDCIGPCDWMTKVLALTGLDRDPLIQNPIVFQYEIANWKDLIANGTFTLARMGVPEGFRLRSVTLTCDRYDLDTSFNFTLNVEGVPNVPLTTITASQAQILIPDITDIQWDDEIEVVIADVAWLFPDTAARGLIVNLIGDLIPV